MSVNYVRGEFGQASQNDHNFGHGAIDNTQGWGSIHSKSWGNPRTNLVGGSPIPENERVNVFDATFDLTFN